MRVPRGPRATTTAVLAVWFYPIIRGGRGRICASFTEEAAAPTAAARAASRRIGFVPPCLRRKASGFSAGLVLPPTSLVVRAVVVGNNARSLSFGNFCAPVIRFPKLDFVHDDVAMRPTRLLFSVDAPSSDSVPDEPSSSSSVPDVASAARVEKGAKRVTSPPDDPSLPATAAARANKRPLKGGSGRVDSGLGSPSKLKLKSRPPGSEKRKAPKKETLREVRRRGAALSVDDSIRENVVASSRVVVNYVQGNVLWDACVVRTCWNDAGEKDAAVIRFENRKTEYYVHLGDIFSLVQSDGKVLSTEKSEVEAELVRSSSVAPIKKTAAIGSPKKAPFSKSVTKSEVKSTPLRPKRRHPGKLPHPATPGIKKKTSPRKKRNPVEPGSLDPPPDWERVYSLVVELRADKSAPVDFNGSHTLPQRNLGEATYRFQILVALMLSSQTKDAVVGEAMRALQKHGLTVENIHNTEHEALNTLIGKVGFHNNKTKYIKNTAQILLDQYGGDIPPTVVDMMALPGVGPKMAYIVESTAFGTTTGIGVDTHMHRMFNNLGWVKSSNPEQTRAQLEGWLPRERWSEVNVLWVGFGQEVQQQKEKALRKALECSRPKEALGLVRKLGLDLGKEGKRFGMENEIKKAISCGGRT